MSAEPEVKIEFLLTNGTPEMIQGMHYRIKVSIANIPDDVYSVQYRLDPTYINSFRIEDNRSENFCFITTTYGDYSLSANLMGRTQNYLISCIVSTALSKSSSGNANEAISSALSAIRSR